MTAPLTYPPRVETVRRETSRPRAFAPLPELAVTEPTARLERCIVTTVAQMCHVLADAHNLKQMTRGDLVRLIRVGELAKQELEENNKEIEQ